MLKTQHPKANSPEIKTSHLELETYTVYLKLKILNKNILYKKVAMCQNIKSTRNNIKGIHNQA